MTKVPKKRKPKDSNHYPQGLDAARTKAIADYYDSLKDEELPERAAVDSTWVQVPREIVPQVLKLIARRKKPA